MIYSTTYILKKKVCRKYAEGVWFSNAAQSDLFYASERKIVAPSFASLPATTAAAARGEKTAKTAFPLLD